MNVNEWSFGFDHVHPTHVTSPYWNDSFAADDVTTDNSNSSTVASLTGSRVFQRHTNSELYAIYRPSIDAIDRYVTPIWYTAGFPGNALAFLIWIRPRMRASSGCFLAALAFNDLLFLSLHLVFELQATWDVRLVERPGVCQAFPIVFLAAQYLNPLLVLGFSVERYIAICHPFRRPTYCTTSRAVRVIVALAVFSLALHSVQGYFWHYNDGDCRLRAAVTESGADSLWSIWSWTTELVVFGVVPLVILVLNAAVIAETRRLCTVSSSGSGSNGNCSTSSSTASTRNHLLNGDGSSPHRRMSPLQILLSHRQSAHLQLQAPVACLRRYRRHGFRTAATTVMLMAVSFYLIVATLPVTLCYVLHLSFPEGNLALDDEAIWSDSTWQAHFDYWNVRTIIQELSMSHYACNFYIYLATGKLFRQELRAFCSPRSSLAARRGTFSAAAAAAAAGDTSATGGDLLGVGRNLRKHSSVSVTLGPALDVSTVVQLNAVNGESQPQQQSRGALSGLKSRSDSAIGLIGRIFRRSSTSVR
jgi:hypothetical protein